MPLVAVCYAAARGLATYFGLDISLYVTYFGGDEKKAPGVPSDEETRQVRVHWLMSRV